ncbi:hypothetical protein Ctob_003262 [Chrysochromulina tobinii]|uniref:Uncharacterized protein n=1 Tax=Chrysochromulina tobinii TaxID=1460289 RepID=A0A0M0J9T9_9EUKA|nr:hypothetical protein Ctob_003262 [Chrysochromulina tobinii]|eukprot:KOO22958.1 hypothetical protein Ctob_003262 [Chrysochromulina sp. CCMP291]
MALRRDASTAASCFVRLEASAAAGADEGSSRLETGLREKLPEAMAASAAPRLSKSGVRDAGIVAARGRGTGVVAADGSGGGGAGGGTVRTIGGVSRGGRGGACGGSASDRARSTGLAAVSGSEGGGLWGGENEALAFAAAASAAAIAAALISNAQAAASISASISASACSTS